MRKRFIRPAVVVITFAVVFMNAFEFKAESLNDNPKSGEEISTLRQVENPEPAKSGMKRSLKMLMTADAAVRALDGYSTVRMLRNRCDDDRSVPVCNQEDFLPDFITRSRGTIYAYEGGVWLAQMLAVRKLQKHHPRLAKLIPAIDITTTLPFAINNLRLPVSPRRPSVSGK